MENEEGKRWVRCKCNKCKHVPNSVILLLTNPIVKSEDFVDKEVEE